MEYKFISADNHINTNWFPRNVWLDRVSPQFRDRAPRVVESDEGTVWVCAGKRVGRASDGKDNAGALERYWKRGVQVPAGSLPSSDPKTLLQHMDADKVYSAAFYGDTRKWNIEDRELLLEVYRVHNDFLYEISSYAPERLIALPQLPARFPDACLTEVQREVRRGAKGLELSVFDVGQPLFDAGWEPVWAAAAEADVPICCHIGDKSGTPYPPNARGASRAHFSVVPFVAALPIAQVVFSGILERHPTLRVCFAECRVGWIPFLVSWMDRQTRERRPDPTVQLSMLPSEYFKRQVRVTFEHDEVGTHLIREPWSVIHETAMWGADYPHGQGIWPNPEPILDKLLAGYDPSLKQQVVFDRAAEFFHIEAPVPTL